jgi:hypothetical protein
MSTNKRVTDLTDYTSVLPYASEMFGVYQPMISWKSKRTTARFTQSLVDIQTALLRTFALNYEGITDATFFRADCVHSPNFGPPVTNFPTPSTQEIIFVSVFDSFEGFQKHMNGVFKEWLDRCKDLFLLNNGNLFVIGEWLNRFAGFIRPNMATPDQPQHPGHAQ